MPVWLEILLNVIGYAGFIGIAMLHKSRSEPSPEPNAPDAPRVNLPSAADPPCASACRP
jgi:hypothetical protein